MANLDPRLSTAGYDQIESVTFIGTLGGTVWVVQLQYLEEVQ